MLTKDFFLNAFLISYAFLMIWFVMFVFAKGTIYRAHMKWFSLSEQDLAKIHYFLMGFFKLLVIAVFLIPYIALVLSN